MSLLPLLLLLGASPQRGAVSTPLLLTHAWGQGKELARAAGVCWCAAEPEESGIPALGNLLLRLWLLSGQCDLGRGVLFELD